MALESNAKVLFVDDEPDLAELASKKVEKESNFLECHHETEVEKALGKISEFDCIVSDYRMPDKNGLEFLEEVRKKFPDLPFILQTSAGNEKIASKAITAGVTEYLRKDEDENNFEKLCEVIENSILEDQAELETSKHHLRNIFQNSSVEVFLKDTEGEYKLMNSSAAECFGYEPREIPGKTAEELFIEEDAEEIREVDERILETGEGITGEYSRTINGEEKHFMTSKFPHKNEEGEVDGIIGISRDITSRKMKKRRLETIFNNAKDIMGFIDTDRTILRMNDTVEDYFENSKEDILGEKLGSYNYFFPEDEVKEMFNSEVLKGNSVKKTVETEDKDGDQKIFNFSLIPIKDDQNNVSSVLAEIQDVTETKRNERQLEAIFDSSFGLIGVVDPEGKILRVNKSVEDVFGVDNKEITGKHYREIDNIIESKTLNQVHDKFVKSSYFQELLKKDIFRHEVSIEKPDGRTAILDVSLKPVKNENGEITSVIAEGRDITSLKSSERQLKDQNKRLERFSRILSHDLRNPLNVASGYLDLAEETGNQKDFEKAKNAIKRMDEIIEELLTLSGKPSEFEKEQLNLKDVFREAYSFVDANPDYTVEQDMELVGGKSGIVRMFENMIVNSVDHNEDVEIEVGSIENGFYYKDDGKITEDIDKVTEYGYTSSENGNGVGLSVIHRVAEINDWNLNIVKSDDGALKFEFLLNN